MTVCSLIKEVKSKIKELVPVKQGQELSPIKPTQSVLQVNPVTGRSVVAPNIRNIPVISSPGVQTNIPATSTVNRLVHLVLGGIIPGYTIILEQQRPSNYTQQYQQYYGYQRNRDKDILSDKPRRRKEETTSGDSGKKYGAINTLPNLRNILWLRNFYSSNLYTKTFTYVDNISRKHNIKINLRILPEGLYVGYEALIKNRFNRDEYATEEITTINWNFLREELERASFPKKLYLYDLKLEFRYKEWAPEYHQIVHKIYLVDKEINRPREVVLDSEIIDNWAWQDLNINNPQSLGITEEEFEEKKPNLLIKLGEIVELDETIYDSQYCRQYYDYDYGEEVWTCQTYFTGDPRETLLLKKFPELPEYAPLFVNPKKSQLKYISSVEIEVLDTYYLDIYNPWIDHGLRAYYIYELDYQRGYAKVFVGDAEVYSTRTKVKIIYNDGRINEYYDTNYKRIYALGFIQEYVRQRTNVWPWYIWRPISEAYGTLYFHCELRDPNGIYERKITLEKIEFDEGDKTIVPLMEQVRDIGKYSLERKNNNLILRIKKRTAEREEESNIEADIDFILPEGLEDLEETFLDYFDDTDRFKDYEEIIEDLIEETEQEEADREEEEFIYYWPLPPVPDIPPLPLPSEITIPRTIPIPLPPMTTPIPLPPIGGWQQVPGQLLTPPPRSTPASPITRLPTPNIPRNNIIPFPGTEQQTETPTRGGSTTRPPSGTDFPCEQFGACARRQLPPILRRSYQDDLRPALDAWFNARLEDIRNTLQRVENNTVETLNRIGDPAMGVGGQRTLFGSLRFATLRIIWNNAMTAVGVIVDIHNAMMLSRNIAETLGQLIDNTLMFFNLKDEDGEPLNIAQIIGEQITNWLKKIVGEENWNKISKEFKKWSAIYTAAANILQHLTNMLAGLAEACETIAEMVGKIGNAIKGAAL
ncbi:MAG: hypothetical protein QXM92_03515, partial [Candidatus Anstonellales archaeon]